ncbi:hypothetical protein GPECTOR_2g1241 [Gonium pectorale]|uniref:Golgi apparatus membrane protein TVP23 n=1 Tax=Gonium pectorale TaxID=33097 RepID=A0A150H0T0_GONPE|nr:hypothetical protein GPECTOR_2g1241 [Gonium pectorale]|eukprot:KXZ55691.1 hypothetical protein GPECTOR_2g1241 [Gonium pectorale]
MATPGEGGAQVSTEPPASSHNIALFFHGGFKVVSIVWYWICTIVSDSFVVNFVVCIVLLGLDFWTGVRTILPREKRLFWMAMMAATGHWVLACIIALFGLSSYIIVAIMGLLFSGSNLYGYFKCSREAQADLQGYINSTSNNLMQGAIKQQLNQAVSRV